LQFDTIPCQDPLALGEDLAGIVALILPLFLPREEIERESKSCSSWENSPASKHS
jgi:hypothetical protein